MFRMGLPTLNFGASSIQALQDRTGVYTAFRWIPSHVSKEQAEDCFEEWVIHWNGLVDQLAVQQTVKDWPLFVHD
jgi:hypothetical protein